MYAIIIFSFQVIRKALPIVPGGPAYGAWKDLPMPIITSLYFFNVTNAEDVQLRGAVPVLEEIGPYVYQEWHNKKKIVYNTGNDTLTYQQARTYFFDAEATGKLSLEDRIVTLNAPAATINSMAKKEAAFTRGIIDIGLKAIGTSGFLPRGLSCELKVWSSFRREVVRHEDSSRAHFRGVRGSHPERHQVPPVLPGPAEDRQIRLLLPGRRSKPEPLSVSRFPDSNCDVILTITIATDLF